MLARRSVARKTLPALALAGALALSACGGDSPGDAAPAPVEALPAPVQSLAVSTDVGQFFVTPEGKPQAEIDETVAKLKSMEGVQSAEFTEEKVVDLQFSPSVTPDQREAAIKQLAALGDVQEGI